MRAPFEATVEVLCDPDGAPRFTVSARSSLIIAVRICDGPHADAPAQIVLRGDSVASQANAQLLFGDTRVDVEQVRHALAGSPRFRATLERVCDPEITMIFVTRLLERLTAPPAPPGAENAGHDGAPRPESAETVLTRPRPHAQGA